MCPSESNSDHLSQVFEDASQGPSDRTMERISELVLERKQLSREAAKAKSELDSLNEKIRNIDENLFPDLFDGLGITSLTALGKVFSIREKLYGSLPKNPESRAKAVALVKKLGGEQLFKTTVTVKMDRGESDKAQQAREQLEEYGSVEVLEDIHPNTLKAWANEQMIEQGTEVDVSALGLYHRRFLEIKEK